jgi:hypothetical protein
MSPAFVPGSGLEPGLVRPLSLLSLVSLRSKKWRFSAAFRRDSRGTPAVPQTILARGDKRDTGDIRDTGDKRDRKSEVQRETLSLWTGGLIGWVRRARGRVASANWASRADPAGRPRRRAGRAAAPSPLGQDVNTAAASAEVSARWLESDQ